MDQKSIIPTNTSPGNIVEYPVVKITLQRIGKVSKAHIRDLLGINYDELAVTLKELKEQNEEFKAIYTDVAARRHYLTANMVVMIMQSVYANSKIIFLLPEKRPKRQQVLGKSKVGETKEK